jgi:UDP-N-acetylmuramoyl-tripeptide--D-alanyl-D-alanine ligase
MSVAIENFIQLKNANKIAILGDMFELGEDSLEEHKSIVNLLLTENSITTYFIGKDFYYNKTEQINCSFYKTFEAFSEAFKTKKIENSLILIKGSRGMALERTLGLL